MRSLKATSLGGEHAINLASLMPCSAFLAGGLWAACLAEVFLLGLEGKFENVGLGAITAEQALAMEAIGTKHGMSVAPEKLTLFPELLDNPRLAEESRRRFLASQAARPATL
jgi:hypothetical protein